MREGRAREFTGVWVFMYTRTASKTKSSKPGKLRSSGEGVEKGIVGVGGEELFLFLSAIRETAQVELQFVDR